MRWLALNLLLCLLILLPQVPAAAVGLPAGTQIQLVANASYLNSEDEVVESEPASVILAVLRVAGVRVQQIGETGEGICGQQLYVPITITNTGNAADIFALTTSSASAWSVDVVYDDNADGVHQEDEQWVIDSAGPMIADGYTPCFVRVSVPQDATSPDTVTLTAVSSFDSQAFDEIQIIVDTTPPPSVSVTSPTNQQTFTSVNPTVDLAGTASGGRAITEVEWSADNGGSGTCEGTSTWSASGIALQTGPNVITVTATDSAGRTATASLTVIFNDPASPNVTILTPSGAETYSTNNAQIQLAGTASDNVGVQNVSWANDRGGSGACTGGSSWSAGTVSLMSGQNVIVVTATDAAGNAGTDAITVTYTPDPLVPNISITSPTILETYTTTSGTLNLGGTASDSLGVASVSWSSNRGFSGACSGTTSWSAAVTLLAGDNVITATATNTSGESSSDVLTVTYDANQPPVVAISSPTSNATYTTGIASITLAGTATHDAGIASVTWSNLHVGSGTCSGTSQWTASGIVLRTGVNVITVSATSAQGDTAADTITVTCTAPSVEITSPASSGTYLTQRALLDLAGTASGAVATISWSSNRGYSGTCSGTTSWSAAAVPLAMGQNVITVTASDGQGNGDSATLTVSRTEDTTDPVISITAPTDQSRVTRNCPFVTIGGSASDNAELAGVTYINTTTGETGTCALEGAEWSAAGIVLVAGDNEITATATDASGNTASATVTVSYVDLVPGDAWKGLAMVSLPIIPDEADPRLAAGFIGNTWCTFLTDICEYAVYPDIRVWLEPAAETPGRGFWARFGEDVAVPYGAIPPQDQPATLHLKTGWNLVGMPFTQAVTWDVSALMVRAPGGVAVPMRDAPAVTPGTAWGWRQDEADPQTGAYYLIADPSVVPDAENTLRPWMAYWIRAYSDFDLIIQPPN